MNEQEFNEVKEKAEKAYEILFEQKGTADRTVYDDLVLLRLVYNRFKSAKFFVGLLVGVLTVGMPAIWGVIKLIAYIKAKLF
jgi:hypothetical protein